MNSNVTQSSIRSIRHVVQQHAEDAVILWHTRCDHAKAPHVKLRHLLRFDDRIAAHLDGLAVAGDDGWRLCEASLENPGCGQLFVAAVRAIEDRNQNGLEKLLAIAHAVPGTQPGLISAFGWVSSQHLQGTVKWLLSSEDAIVRSIGFATCSMHQVDPGQALDRALTSAETALRTRALRCAGELGRRDLLPITLAALQDETLWVRLWAARSAILLGDRNKGLDVLMPFIRAEPSLQRKAFPLLLRAASLDWLRECLRSLAQKADESPASKRLLIEACGLAGDSHYIPWLITQMADDKFSRLAGESFSLITGLDLAWRDLDRKPPENFEGGPNDNPDDPDISGDPDDGLPWPNQVKVGQWWESNSQAFPAGTRFFMGEPITEEHCLRALREGYQRQRIAAAEYLRLLRPGEPLFNTAAPAWRQKRMLEHLPISNAS